MVAGAQNCAKQLNLLQCSERFDPNSTGSFEHLFRVKDVLRQPPNSNNMDDLLNIQQVDAPTAPPPPISESVQPAGMMLSILVAMTVVASLWAAVTGAPMQRFLAGALRPGIVWFGVGILMLAWVWTLLRAGGLAT